MGAARLRPGPQEEEVEGREADVRREARAGRDASRSRTSRGSSSSRSRRRRAAARSSSGSRTPSSSAARSGSGRSTSPSRWGDRLAIAGPNGSGKTTLLDALLGRLPLAAGARWVGPGVVLGELEQDRARARRAADAARGLPRTSRRGRPARCSRSSASAQTTSCARPPRSHRASARARALALLAARGVNCLVLDEPTNHLDVEAIEELERGLAGYDGTVSSSPTTAASWRPSRPAVPSSCDAGQPRSSRSGTSSSRATCRTRTRAGSRAGSRRSASRCASSRRCPDEIDTVAAFVRAEAPRVDFLLVTGGLGGTPDDLTREAIAAAFGVPQEEVPELAAELRARFTRNPGVRGALGAACLAAAGRSRTRSAARPASCSRTSTSSRACRRRWRRCSRRSRRSSVAAARSRRWRRVYRTYESVIAAALAEAVERWPGVLVGSYPSFGSDGSTVEVVLKSSDADALAAASAWLAASDRRGRRTVGRTPRSRT